jgi:nicotinate (nicotinamide) nucleotide adenylyltransferase
MRKRSEKERLDWLRQIIENTPVEGPSVLRWVRRACQGITEPGKSLGAFPSSFNPPTTAHRVIIERARNVEPLDELLLILDRKAMDKEIFGASLEERLSMILLCFEKDRSVSVALTSRGRFVEKLALLLNAYPPDTKIHFIVGHDTLIRVLDPGYYENRDAALRHLFAASRFLVAGRGNVGIDEIRALMNQKENRTFSQRIVPFEIPSSMAQVSSTYIRKEIERGGMVDEIVPREIMAYIEKRGLYRKLTQD